MFSLRSTNVSLSRNNSDRWTISRIVDSNIFDWLISWFTYWRFIKAVWKYCCWKPSTCCVQLWQPPFIRMRHFTYTFFVFFHQWITSKLWQERHGEKQERCSFVALKVFMRKTILSSFHVKSLFIWLTFSNVTTLIRHLIKTVAL